MRFETACFIFADMPSYIIMMLDFLPSRISGALRYINLNLLYELRIRAEKPLRVNVGGIYRYLGEKGVTASEREALMPTEAEIRDTVFAASGFSVYAVENQLRSGFLTGKCGERIGIAGTFVYDGKGVLSVNEATSLCVRVPHEILGCAEEIYDRCFREGICSLLLMSPPGEGKTTILRDLTRLVCERTQRNVLVVDERGELSAGNLGATSDVVRFADKLTAFTAGIRALRPDLIVTDELLEGDYKAVRRAVESGITVFATAHLKRWEDVSDKLFGRYVLLDGLGKIGKIFGENGENVD